MTQNTSRDTRIGDPLIQRDINPAHSFTFGEHTYECHPLQPLEQIHVARRLAPLIAGALRPEDGRAVILQRLAKVAGLGSSKRDTPIDSDLIADAAMDLAASVLEAASAIDEETVNDVIRKCMLKMWRQLPSGGKQTLWYKPLDRPSFPDIDGFVTLALVGRYLAGEFQGRISEYIASLDLKPGPALAAAMGAADPTPRAAGEMWKPPTPEQSLAEARG